MVARKAFIFLPYWVARNFSYSICLSTERCAPDALS
jgi:hypothetical protein